MIFVVVLVQILVGKLEIKEQCEERLIEVNGQRTIVNIWGMFPSSLFPCIFFQSKIIYFGPSFQTISPAQLKPLHKHIFNGFIVIHHVM